MLHACVEEICAEVRSAAGGVIDRKRCPVSSVAVPLRVGLSGERSGFYRCRHSNISLDSVYIR